MLGKLVSRKATIVTIFIITALVVRVCNDQLFYKKQKERFNATTTGQVLEYKSRKPIENVQVRVFYKSYSEKNTTPFLGGLDHRSTTSICYATHYTVTNIKGEFSFPSLPETITILKKDDEGRRMINYHSISLYHPKYIFLAKRGSIYSSSSIKEIHSHSIEISGYPNNMNDKTRYMYLIAKSNNVCGKLLSSQQNLDIPLKVEINKLEDKGIQYDAMNIDWDGPAR